MVQFSKPHLIKTGQSQPKLLLKFMTKMGIKAMKRADIMDSLIKKKLLMLQYLESCLSVLHASTKITKFLNPLLRLMTPTTWSSNRLMEIKFMLYPEKGQSHNFILKSSTILGEWVALTGPLKRCKNKSISNFYVFISRPLEMFAHICTNK